MRIYKIMLAASLGLLLSACSSNMADSKKVGKTTNKADDSEIAYADRVTCTTRAVTGSHFKKKRCITNRQKELEQEAAEEVIRTVTTGVGDNNN